MRILFIVEHFPCLSETFVLNQITSLFDMGHDVWIYPLGTPSGSVYHTDVLKYGLLSRTYHNAAIPTSKLKRVHACMRLMPGLFRKIGFKVLRGLNPLRYGIPAINLSILFHADALAKNNSTFDQIQCHFGDKGLYALAFRDMGILQGNIAVVFHAHEICRLSDSEGRRQYGLLFQQDILLLPISNLWRERLIRWGADPDRTLLHRMGVDTDRFVFNPTVLNDSEPVRILSVGRLVGQKGFEYAIRGIAELRKMTRRELKFEIIGAGPLDTVLARLISELGLDRDVSLIGVRSQEEVKRKLEASHIFLLSSVTDKDGFQEGIPVALMEAMACGVPVVTTRHSGIPELVEDNVTGCLTKERDSLAIAMALKSLIEDGGLRERVVRQARKLICEQYNIVILMRAWIEMVRTYAEQGKSKRLS